MIMEASKEKMNIQIMQKHSIWKISQVLSVFPVYN